MLISEVSAPGNLIRRTSWRDGVIIVHKPATNDYHLYQLYEGMAPSLYKLSAEDAEATNWVLIGEYETLKNVRSEEKTE